MIRETLAPDSRHAFALISAGAGYVFERRINTAGITQSTRISGRRARLGPSRSHGVAH